MKVQQYALGGDLMFTPACLKKNNKPLQGPFK